MHNYKCPQASTEDSNGAISPHMYKLPNCYIGQYQSIGYFESIGNFPLGRVKNS